MTRARVKALGRPGFEVDRRPGSPFDPADRSAAHTVSRAAMSPLMYPTAYARP